jgi:hypothetical protein
MSTVSKSFLFNSDSEGWVATVTDGAVVTAAWSSAQGGELSMRIAGKNKVSANNYWQWTGTFQDLGVPSNGTVTGIGLGGSSQSYYSGQCSEWVVGGTANNTGPFEIRNSGAGTLIGTFSAQQTNYTSTTAWTKYASSAVSIPSAPATSGITLRLYNDLQTASSNSAAVTILQDDIYFDIGYSVPSGTDGYPKVRIAGSFTTKPPKVKIGGTFTTKTLKVKVGGSFISAIGT